MAGSRWLSIAALLLASIAPLLALTPMLMNRKVIPQDEGQLVTYPALMLHGLQPNTDFVYTYGINNLWTLTLAFEAFGASLVVERSVGLVIRLVLVVAVTDMVRRSAGTATALVAGWICALLLASVGIQAFAWISALTVGVLAVWVAANISTGRRPIDEALPWLLAGLAVGFRVDIAVSVVVALMLVRWCRTSSPVTLWAALGFVVGLTPIWVHLLTADNVLKDSILDPILNGSGRRLPLVPHDRVLALSILLLLVSVATICAVLWMRRSQKSAVGYTNLLGLGSLSVLTLPQVLQRVDSTHFSYVAVVLLPAAISAVAYAFATSDRAEVVRPVRRVGASVVALVACAGVALGLIPFLRPTALLARAAYTGDSASISTEVRHGGRQVPVDPSHAEDLKSLLERASAFHSSSCDRLFVGPSDLRFAWYSDTFIHFMLPEFTPATRYLEFNPDGANARDSALAADLGSADVVVLNSDWDDPGSLDQPGAATPNKAGPAAPNKVIESRFTPVESFGPWTLLVSEDCRRKN